MAKAGRGTVTVTVPDPRKSWAVLIGISDYAHAELPAMPAAAAGAHRLAGLLRDPSIWGLPEEHVTVIGSTTTVEQILGAVRDAALGAADTLVVYFAGHGLRDNSEKLYLALAPADADYPQIGTLPYLQLRDVIRRSGYRTRHRVTVLDCCFSGLAGGMSTASAPTRPELARSLGELEDFSGEMGEQERGEDRYGDCVLTSAPSSSRSFVPPGAAFPEFTGELIDILETGIPEADETVSLETTWRRIRDRMRRRGSPEPQQFAQNNVTHHLHLHNRAVASGPELEAEPAPASVLATTSEPREVIGTGQTPSRAVRAGGRALVTPHESSAYRQVDHLAAHEQPVKAVAYSPDGKLFASGDEEGNVRLWERGGDTWTLLASFDTYQGATNALAFSPDGVLLAVGSNELVQLWNTALCQPFGDILSVHWADIDTLVFSPDGMLAIAGRRGKVRWWDTATQQPTSDILNTGRNVSAMVYTPDSTLLAVADIFGETVQWWDIDTRQQAGKPLPVGDFVSAMAYAPGSTQLAVVRSGAVHWWDTDTRRPAGRSLGYRAGWGVRALAISPDARLLATAGDDGIVRWWATATGQPYGVRLQAE